MLPTLTHPSVVADSYAGMRSAMEHMIKMHGREKKDLSVRYTAYLDIQKENGIPIDENRTSPPGIRF